MLEDTTFTFQLDCGLDAGIEVDPEGQPDVLYSLYDSRDFR